MRAHHCYTLTLFSFALATATPAWAHAEYRLTVMGPAGSVATGINNAGVVVGNYRFSSTSTHAFLNRGKGLVNLGTAGGVASAAVAINDKGVVLGHWTRADGQQRGFLSHRGAIRDIGVIPGRDTTFTDINNAGFITAYGTSPDSFAGLAGFLRAPDGSYRNIGALAVEDPITYAFALNEHKQVAGASGPLVFPEQPFRAIVWSKGVMRDLGGLGWEPNYARAINNCGQITGSASIPTGIHSRVAFLYSKGRLVDIDGRTTEQRSSEGLGINKLGHVVGASDHLSGFVYRGRRMQSLNSLTELRPGWDIQVGVAINDAGQIAATAYRGNLSYAVRLDLIRPQLERAALEEADEDVALPPGEAEQKADADAQAREVALPVRQ